MLNDILYFFWSIFSFSLNIFFVYFTARWLRVLHGLDDGIDLPAWFYKLRNKLKRKK